MKKILQLLTGFQSYDQIRIIQPLLQIRDRLKSDNIVVQLMPMQTINEDIIRQFDVVCFHGCLSLAVYPVLHKIKFCLWVDDLMINLPPTNPAHPSKEEIDGLLWCYTNAKTIITTTEFLKNKINNPNIYVCPNLINIERKINTSRKILYSFGNSHTGDLEILNCLETERKVYFFGHTLPSKFANYQRNNLGLIELFSNKNNIYHIPLQTDYEKYSVWMKNTDYGVGLIPLEDNDFNKAKSILKVGEYLQNGAISVASDIGAYKEIPNHVVVKVGQDNDWDSAVEFAFANHKTIYNSAFDYWMGNYSYEKQARKWITAYREM